MGAAWEANAPSTGSSVKYACVIQMTLAHNTIANSSPAAR